MHCLASADMQNGISASPEQGVTGTRHPASAGINESPPSRKRGALAGRRFRLAGQHFAFLLMRGVRRCMAFSGSAGWPNGMAVRWSKALAYPATPPSRAVRGEAAAVGEERLLVGQLDPLAVELREGERGAGVLGEVGADEDGIVVGDGDEAAVEGTVEVGAKGDAVTYRIVMGFGKGDDVTSIYHAHVFIDGVSMAFIKPSSPITARIVLFIRDISLLIITTMFFVNYINQTLHFFVQTMKCVKFAILGIVPKRRALRQPLFNVRRYQERGSVTKVFLKLCQENIDAR